MNRFNPTEVSGSLLLTFVGGEFCAICVQLLPIFEISLEKCSPEIQSGM